MLGPTIIIYISIHNNIHNHTFHATNFIVHECITTNNFTTSITTNAQTIIFKNRTQMTYFEGNKRTTHELERKQTIQQRINEQTYFAEKWNRTHTQHI